MCRPSKATHSRPTMSRGFTVIEMVIAIGLVGMIGAALATLSTAAHTSNSYVQDTGDTVQHARVTIERIRRAIQDAHASDDFPAFLVVEEDVSSWTFYDTLVVWRPSSTAANPDGLPLVEELVLFTYDRADPTRLLEITLPGDASVVPATSDADSWASLVASIQSDSDAVEIELTDMLHTEEIASSTRGVLQFSVVHHPSETEWASYKAGDTEFDDLPWALDIRGAKSGLRQSRVAFDFQLQSSKSSEATNATVVPFFGSAATYYELKP